MKKYLLLLLLMSLLVGCGSEVTPTPAPTAVAIATTVPEPTDAPTAVPSTDTPIPPTEAAEPATVTPLPINTDEPTAEPTTVTSTEAAELTTTHTPTSESTEAATTEGAEVTVTPTEDVGDGTATAVPVAPPAGGVTQPPYQASSCSDKYPCNDDVEGWEERIQVPAGFTDSYFARVTGQPTSMTFGPDGRLYVAVQEGSIYAINQSGGISTYASGFNTPTGIAFQPGTSRLFVSSRVLNENVGGEAQVSVANGGQIVGGLPCCYTYLHAANGIAFGPDGMGYVSVGGRADHGEILDGSNRQDERHPLEASILKFNPNGGGVEVYARGFRNSYDIAWDANGRLYATDNAPDYGPPEEFHVVVPGAEHGYPWFDCDGCFAPPADVSIIPPLYQFTPHAAPTGLTSYLSDQFPGYYNSLFVTLWSAFPGAQKVVRFGPGGIGASDFAMGFAAPIDVTVGPDGSLYVADWATGIIFKISYTG